MAAPIGNFQLELEKRSDALASDVIDFLTEIKSEHEVLNKVTQLSSIGDIHWITTFLDNCYHVHWKSNSQATLLKTEGNKHFQKKRYKDSLDKYTEAIFLADRNTEDLALVYGNRSATLYRLGLYKECLTDVTEALNCECPYGILHKLLIRKANCLIQLQRVEEVTECLEEVKKLVSSPDTELNKTEQILQEVKAIEESSCCIKSRCVIEDVKVTPPCVSYGYSDTIVQATSAVHLEYTQDKGRFLVACKEIQPGDTLIVETPYAAVLLPEHYGSNCHHCFVKVIVPYPCRQCSKVKYCSPRCATVSWETYHHIECVYLPLLHTVGIAHLSLRIVLTAGLQYLMGFKKSQQMDDDIVGLAGLDKNGQYCHNYQTVYDLLTHIEHMDAKDILQYTMTAQLLLKILQHSDWFNVSNKHCCTENQSDKSSKCEICQSQSTELRTKIENNSKKKFDESSNNSKIKLSNKLANNCTIKVTESSNNSMIKNDESSDCDTNVHTEDGCNHLLSSLEKSINDSVGGSACSEMEECNKNVADAVKDSLTTCKSSAQECTQKRSDTAGATIENRTDVCQEKDRDNDRSISEGCHAGSTDSGVLQTSDGDSLGDPCDVSDELYIGGLLLRHILQLVCNAHAITDLQCNQIEDGSNVEEKSQVRIATAIYPTASLMNHACDPTIISSFSKDTLIVRATKHVEVGGEIYNCYGPHYRRMDYKERQRCLREQYFFTCNCVPCMPGESQQDLYNCYLCTACSGPATRSKDDVFTCKLCKKELKIDVNIINQMERLFHGGCSLLNQNKLKEATSVMLECYSIAKMVLYKHNKHLSEITDCVGRCYAMSGKFVQAAKYVRESVDTVEVMFGAESVEVGNELQKLSEILISAQQWQDALKVTDRACQIFELNYGKSHDIVNDLSSARRELKDVVKALC